MSVGHEVVVAGGGVAAAATAIRLRRLGIAVRLLVRPGPGIGGVEALPERALGLLDVLGEPDLVTEAGGVAVTGQGGSPLVHVERRALAATILRRARERGAVVDEVRRLPARAVVAGTAAAVVDATGRAAAWSRPLLTDGHDVAWQFEGRPDADPALRVVLGAGWWAYRLGTPGTTWAGVVTDDHAVEGGGRTGGRGAACDEGLRRLGLDPSTMVPRGRRAARVQRAVHPVAGARIAVGDAALAHDPIAGGGIRFALASAVAATTTLVTWVENPDRRHLASAYYDELVAGEHARHLAARRVIHAEAGEPMPAEAAEADAEAVPDVVRFTAAVVDAPLVVDGAVRPGAAVRLPDGTLTRWLGSFDLLVLARVAAEPVPRLVLLTRLQHEGLDAVAARAVVTWAARHRLLTG